MSKNNTYTVEGVVTELLPVRPAGSATARDFVIKTTEDYPQLLKFELYGKNVALVDDVEVDTSVAVTFGIRGREWNGKIINNNSAFRVEKTVEAPPAKAAAAPAEPKKAPAPKPAAKPATTAPAPVEETDEPVF
mgnify:FL=1